MKNWEIPEEEFSFGSSSNKTIAGNEIKEQMINNRVWALLILKIKDNVVGDIYALQLKIGENIAAIFPHSKLRRKHIVYQKRI
ncbi:MAG: hypothetical protein KGD65_14560 [Candidatus Lokiarchaeota archaeon]|nr:hypothetical protein [Candidatus Lokiarchaeota archaeon]